MLADAAENLGAAQRRVAAIGAEGIADLDRELAGRGQDQRANAVAPCRRALGGEMLQDRQRERGGLAGAGLGDAQKVAARQKMRDRLRLDRRRLMVIFGLESTQERFGQAEIGKGNGHGI